MIVQDHVTITRALADESRLRTLMALRHGDLCLCQVIDLLGLAPSTVSKHVSVLQRAGLVEQRKEGRWHFYSLAATGASAEVERALEWVKESLRDDPVILADAQKLEEVRQKDLVQLSGCYRA
ncbi:MAG: metalloregulator ArsR/SmtB family transcription factor [Thermoanaerobaculia bacterium]